MEETKTAKRLRLKVDAKKNDAIVEAILKADINGLKHNEAWRKLNNVIEDAVEKFQDTPTR